MSTVRAVRSKSGTGTNGAASSSSTSRPIERSPRDAKHSTPGAAGEKSNPIADGFAEAAKVARRFGNDPSVGTGNSELLRPDQTLSEALRERTGSIKEALDEHYPNYVEGEFDGPWCPETLKNRILHNVDELHISEQEDMITDLNGAMVSRLRLNRTLFSTLCEKEVDSDFLGASLERRLEDMASKVESVDKGQGSMITLIKECVSQMLGVLARLLEERAHLKDLEVREAKLVIDDAKRAHLEERKEEVSNLGTNLMRFRKEEEMFKVNKTSNPELTALEEEVKAAQASAQEFTEELERLARRLRAVEGVQQFIEGPGFMPPGMEDGIIETVEEMKGQVRSRTVMPMLHQFDRENDSTLRSRDNTQVTTKELKAKREELLERRQLVEEEMERIAKERTHEEKVNDLLEETCPPHVREFVRVAPKPMVIEKNAGDLYAAFQAEAQKLHQVGVPLTVRLKNYITYLDNAQGALSTMSAHRAAFITHIKSMKEPFIQDALAREIAPRETSAFIRECIDASSTPAERLSMVSRIWSEKEEQLCDGVAELDARVAAATKIAQTTLANIEKLRAKYDTYKDNLKEPCGAFWDEPVRLGPDTRPPGAPVFEVPPAALVVQATAKQREAQQKILNEIVDVRVEGKGLRRHTRKKSGGQPHFEENVQAQSRGESGREAKDIAQQEAPTVPNDEQQRASPQEEEQGEIGGKEAQVQRKKTMPLKSVARASSGLLASKKASTLNETAAKKLVATAPTRVGPQARKKATSSFSSLGDETKETEGGQEGSEDAPGSAKEKQSARRISGPRGTLTVSPRRPQPKAINRRTAISSGPGYSMESVVKAATGKMAAIEGQDMAAEVQEDGGDLDEPGGGHKKRSPGAAAAMPSNEDVKKRLRTLLRQRSKKLKGTDDSQDEPHDDDSENSSRSEPEEVETASEGVQNIRKLHARSERLAAQVQEGELQMASLVSMVGGLPIEPSRCHQMHGGEQQKYFIALKMQELIDSRQKWWAERQQHFHQIPALGSVTKEQMEFDRSYKMFKNLISIDRVDANDAQDASANLALGETGEERSDSSDAQSQDGGGAGQGDDDEEAVLKAALREP